MENTETDLELQIRKQVEYYFSTDNLIKDIYLRKSMLIDGWILLSTIASFRMILVLTNDIDLIIKSLKCSLIVEISFDNKYVRTKLNPTKWVLNNFNTTEENPNEKSSIVIDHLHVMRKRAISDLTTVLEMESCQIENKYISDSINSILFEEDFKDREIQSLLIVTPDYYQDMKEWRNQYTQNMSISRNFRSISLSEPNNFLLDNKDILVQPRFQNANNFYKRSKSISNSENRNKILPKIEKRVTQNLKNIKWSYEISCSKDVNDKNNQNQIGFILSTDDGKITLQYDKERHLHGFSFQDYTTFKNNCLIDKNYKENKPSQKMNMLYRFWSFFLREHFNKRLFVEFRNYSREDFNNNKRYGSECLFRFYSYGLEKTFRKEIFNYFQIDTLEEYNKGYRYGLEKFWAFLHYSQRKVEINTDLNKILKNYKSLQDFRIDFIPPEGYFTDE